jgi:hypothetical protein
VRQAAKALDLTLSRPSRWESNPSPMKLAVYYLLAESRSRRREAMARRALRHHLR